MRPTSQLNFRSWKIDSEGHRTYRLGRMCLNLVVAASALCFRPPVHRTGRPHCCCWKPQVVWESAARKANPLMLDWMELLTVDQKPNHRSPTTGDLRRHLEQVAQLCNSDNGLAYLHAHRRLIMSAHNSCREIESPSSISLVRGGIQQIYAVSRRLPQRVFLGLSI